MSSTPIEPLPVATAKDRPLASFTYCEVDSASGARHERDHRWFVAFADDAKRAVPTFEPEIFDVGRTRFRHTQPVQAEQRPV